MKRFTLPFATYLAENRMEIQNSGFDFFQLFKSEILHEQGLENLMHKIKQRKYKLIRIWGLVSKRNFDAALVGSRLKEIFGFSTMLITEGTAVNWPP